MINDWIKITRVKIEGAEKLYPKGIDWVLTPGINAVIGGTGLGKTTLVYAMQFGVFGRMVTDAGDRIEREFFHERLTRRGNKVNDVAVTVYFVLETSNYSVKRNLLSGSLIEAFQNDIAIKNAKYEELIAQNIGLSNDFRSVARIQSHLFFFGEERYLLAWQNLVQHELVNLLMSDHSVYTNLNNLWEEAESADSAARNISAQASRLENDLKTIAAKASTVMELERRAAAKEAFDSRTILEEELRSIDVDLNRSTNILEKKEIEIERVQGEFHNQIEELESSTSEDLDEELLSAALADPNVASMRFALEQFYASPRNHNCPCCGRADIADLFLQHASNAVRISRSGNCVVCSKALPLATNRRSEVTGDKNTLADSLARQLQTLLFEREQLTSRISEIRASEAQKLISLNRARELEQQYEKDDPSTTTNPLRVAVQEMRKNEQRMKGIRDKHLKRLKTELTKTNKVFSTIQNQIASAFKKYATLYLDEPCDVVFLGENEMPSKRGPQIKAPHAAFFPVISGETRPTAQALSDAQRSFVDLAFRMAVIDVWHQQTKKTVTMFIETPEGAVDIAYMERVATMIRTFSKQGHILVITTNLNNSIFLPEIMARRPKSQRINSILNLLKEGNPRPVQLKKAKYFAEVFSKVEAHAVAK